MVELRGNYSITTLTAVQTFPLLLMHLPLTFHVNFERSETNIPGIREPLTRICKLYDVSNTSNSDDLELKVLNSVIATSPASLFLLGFIILISGEECKLIYSLSSIVVNISFPNTLSPFSYIVPDHVSHSCKT